MARASRPRSSRAVVSLIATALSAPLAAAASDGGASRPYRGRSAQAIVVTLSSPGPSGRTFRYRARMRCSDGTAWLDDYFTDRVVVRSARFHSYYVSDRGATATSVTGTLRGKLAFGTLQIRERFSATPDARGDTPLSPRGSIRCASPVVRWSAGA